jgi:hypothetical protein
MARVLIPTHLASYTAGAREVSIAATTLSDVLAGLDARFPGMRFRIVDEQDRVRTHIKFFVDGEMARQLTCAIGPDSEVMIVAALSGG